MCEVSPCVQYIGEATIHVSIDTVTFLPFLTVIDENISNILLFSNGPCPNLTVLKSNYAEDLDFFYSIFFPTRKSWE